MHDKLVQDGMFFVGIDVIGDKVIEINTESPGGLQAIEHLYEVDICPVVIDALERRTRNGRVHADGRRLGHFTWTQQFQYQHDGSPSSRTGKSPSVAASTNSES